MINDYHSILSFRFLLLLISVDVMDSCTDTYTDIYPATLLNSKIHCIDFNDSLVDPLGFSIDTIIFSAISDSSVSLRSLYFLLLILFLLR